MTVKKEENAVTYCQAFTFNASDKKVNPVLIEGNPFFIAVEICEMLGLTNVSKALNMLDDDERLTLPIVRSGQKRAVNLVNESGIYSLIFRSNKPEARLFRKWVTNEVLPQIRRSGAYSPSPNPSPIGEGQGVGQDELCNLIYDAADVAGNQQMLASYLSVSPSVLTDLRNRPGKISVKLMRHVAYGCKKVIRLGSVPVDEIKEINTREVMQMWFDIVKIENYELRTSLSHRIAKIMGREFEFADELSEAKEKGGSNE